MERAQERAEAEDVTSSDRLRAFRVLYELAVAMTGERSLDENLKLVVERARELLGADTSYVALRDETHGDVYMHTLSGIRTEAFRRMRVPFGSGLGGLVATTRRGYIVGDYFNEPGLKRVVDDVVAAEGLISGMAVPIQMEAANLGVLYVFNRCRTRFAPADLDTLFLLGNLAAVEIARKRAEAELRVARDTLELRVAERTAELTRANERLLQEIAERRHSEEERERLEGRLRQAEKLEALGTLAGGIAHDFNNLLMAVEGNASLVALGFPPGHPNLERLATIERCVASGAELTRQLLGFARTGRVANRPLDVNAIVRGTVELFWRAKKEIRVEARYEEPLWAAVVDRGQIEQVLLNLYVNAWHAMPAGGELVLATANVALGREEAAELRLSPGHYIAISVRDTGGGMDEATLRRVFEPFFTTKELGRGTGLGLASAYGIVRGHGGSIQVSSRPGQGSTFVVHLPANPEAVAEPEGAAQAEAEHGSGTILLVDDEAAILEVLGEMLATLGYRVLTAPGGVEAVEVLRANRGRVDAVVLDLVMPGMNGSEAFERLKAVDPGVRVLVSSGYSAEGSASQLLARGCEGFIQKPFTLAAVSQKLRDVLGKRV